MVYITVIVCSSYLPFLTRARGRQSSFCGRPVGMTQREIAEQVGMSQRGVGKALENQTKNLDQVSSSGNEAVPTPPVVPHVARNSGNNEWYTPAEYIVSARRVLAVPVGLARVLCPFAMFDTLRRHVLQSWTRNGPGRCNQHRHPALTTTPGSGAMAEQILAQTHPSPVSGLAPRCRAFCLPAGRGDTSRAC